MDKAATQVDPATASLLAIEGLRGKPLRQLYERGPDGKPMPVPPGLVPGATPYHPAGGSRYWPSSASVVYDADRGIFKELPFASRLESMKQEFPFKSMALGAVGQGLGQVVAAPIKYAPEAAAIGTTRGLLGALAGAAAYAGSRELGASPNLSMATATLANAATTLGLHFGVEKGRRPWDTGTKPILHDIRDAIGLGPDEETEDVDRKGSSRKAS